MILFKPMGLLFRPVSILGWAAVALVLVFAVQTFVAIDRHSHSASDTLYGVFPYWVGAFLLLAFVADRTGGRDS